MSNDHVEQSAERDGTCLDARSAEADCAPGACCPSPTSDGRAAPAGGGLWKTVVFAVVMLLAASVAVHALLVREPGAENVKQPKCSQPCDPKGCPCAGVD
ncbi:MAG: hypothetical protein JSU86_09895 [Phycisphaerales bacterium]|nr:MAG: hypothetical protein JSU86_09895 [Phycisphaerales bacterium]